VLSLAYAMLGVAVGRLVASWYEGTDPAVRPVLVDTLRVAPAIVCSWALLAVPRALSIFVAVLPAVFVFPLFLLVSPVIAIEGLGPLAAIRRSVRLVTRRYPAVVGIWLLALLLERIIDVALGLVPEVVAGFLPAEVAEVVRPAGWAFALFVTAPTVVGLPVLLYFDLRVRSEGLDLEREAAEAFPAS
jgi:hypothetical protein